MNVQRGDVLKARFPHASGECGKNPLVKRKQRHWPWPRRVIFPYPVVSI
jgi:hypothetical protein